MLSVSSTALLHMKGNRLSPLALSLIFGLYSLSLLAEYTPLLYPVT